jgi:uncharacterized protein YjbJ (UPF0337 family)
MSTFREKAQGRTRQMVGEMIGDQQLVEEGKEQVQKAEQESRSSEDRSEPPRPRTLKKQAAS